MLDEGFSNGNSVIHTFDPRARMTVALIFSIVVATSNRFPPLILSIFFSVILVISAGFSINRLLSRLLIINVFVFLFWIIIPFTMEGRILFMLGPFAATMEGVKFSSLITLKTNAITISLMALVGTIPIFTMGRALKCLCVPQKIIHLTLFTFRYIHVIQREYVRRMNAIKIRGFQAGTNIHTYKTFAYLFGMLFLNSFARAERVRSAMLCRGFKGKFYDLYEFNFRYFDLVLLILMLFGVLIIGLLQWTELIF